MKKLGTDAEVAAIVAGWKTRKKRISLKQYARDLGMSINTLSDWIYRGVRNGHVKDVTACSHRGGKDVKAKE